MLSGVSHGQLYSTKLSVLHTIMFFIIIQHCKCTKALELVCSRGVSHGQLYSFKLSVLHTIMFAIIIQHCKCTKTQTLAKVVYTVNHVSATRNAYKTS